MPAGPNPSRAAAAGWGGVVAGIGYALPFVLVLYLSLAGGGYDGVVYGEVGILCWWLVGLGALTGLLPFAPLGRAGWALLAVLGLFCLWTALGISWSDSSERSVAELGRVVAYLGVFALGLSVQGREGLRRTVYGVGTAIAVVGVLALLSRLVPDLFPAIEAARYLDDVEARLSYPLNYWNALAALMAVGIPLMLHVAGSARTAAVQGLAAASVPAMALAAYFTLSRGGALAAVIGVAVLFLLHPRKVAALATVGIALLGSAFLILIASGKNDLQDALETSAAASQGDQMLLIAIVVCALVGLAQVVARAADARGSLPEPEISPGAAWGAAGIAAVLLLAAAVAAGAPGKVADRLDEFTTAEAPDPTAGESRFESLSGNGRYQLWSSAVDAAGTEPLTGVGPGTFEYWWVEDRPIDSYARSAHSLYLNALAEQGIVGMLLVLAVVLVPLGVGAARWARAGPARELFAAALAAGVAFAVAAGVDRAWDLMVLPAAFLFLAAALVSPRSAGSVEGAPEEEGENGLIGLAPRIGVAAIALAAVVVVAIPTATLMEIRDSQADVRAGRLDDALEAARDAGGLEPYASTPNLQEALILERQGALPAAAAAARTATEKESTNWRLWVVLARIEAERGRVGPALEAYEVAHSLNPLSDFFRL